MCAIYSCGGATFKSSSRFLRALTLPFASVTLLISRPSLCHSPVALIARLYLLASIWIQTECLRHTIVLWRWRRRWRHIVLLTIGNSNSGILLSSLLCHMAASSWFVVRIDSVLMQSTLISLASKIYS